MHVRRVIEYFLSNEFVLEELYNMVFLTMRSSVQQRAIPLNLNDLKYSQIKLQQLNLNKPVPEIKMKNSFHYGITSILSKLNYYRF